MSDISNYSYMYLHRYKTKLALVEQMSEFVGFRRYRESKMSRVDCIKIYFIVFHHRFIVYNI